MKNITTYTHTATGSQDTKDGWIASYSQEEIEERGMTAEECFEEDDGVTIIEVAA